MKNQILTLMLGAAIFTTSPLSAMWNEEKSEQERGACHKSNDPIDESQRIKFIPNKEESAKWTKDTIGDSDHDGFIISVTKEKNEEPLTVVCLNMMAFTTMRHTYKVADVNNENDITPAEAQDYKNRLNRIAETLAKRVELKKNLVFVLQEMRQSNLKKGKFIGDDHEDSNTEFRDSFINALEGYTHRKFVSFSKPTITNTFSNMIVVEKDLKVEMREGDRLPELDGLKTGELTERANLIKSGHAVVAEAGPNEKKSKGIKTQKDRALGVEINGIDIYGIHLIHHKCDLPAQYESDLKSALTKIFNRKKDESKPFVLVGDFNFDFKNMRLPEVEGITMGYIPNGALDGKGGQESVDGYIASSELIIK